MPELTKKACLTPTWHGPHPWWWTDSGGGHMLEGEPDETDFESEKGLVQYSCPGKPEEMQTQPHEEPVSEQTFEAYETGVKTGEKQGIKKVYETLIADGHRWIEGDCPRCGEEPCLALAPLEELFSEAGIDL